MVTKVPDTIEQSKRGVAEAVGAIGHKAKESGQAIQIKAHDAAGKTDK
jgi:hypothetical protein